MNKIRQQIRFSGRVQGVGFRYTANEIAQSLGLTGFVFNDWDGTVLMEVQGSRESIDEMIKLLNRNVFIKIDTVDRVNISVDLLEKSFRVK